MEQHFCPCKWSVLKWMGDLAPEQEDLIPSITTCWLCDQGQVTKALWVFVLFSVKWRWENFLHSQGRDEDFLRGNSICRNALLNLKVVFVDYHFQLMCHLKCLFPELFFDSPSFSLLGKWPWVQLHYDIYDDTNDTDDMNDIYDAHRAPPYPVTSHGAC